MESSHSGQYELMVPNECQAQQMRESQSTAVSGTSLKGALIIGALAVFGSLVGVTSKKILSHNDNNFPILISCLQLCALSLLRWVYFRRRSKRFGETIIETTWKTYCQKVLPLAALFALSTCLTNVAYMYLSLPLLQVLKSFLPVLLVPLISSRIRNTPPVEQPVWFHLGLLSWGIFITILGESNPNALGVVFLCGAVMLEGLRRLMSEKTAELLDLKPVEQLLWISPAATVLGAVTFLAMELRRMSSQDASRMRVDLIIVNVASLAGLYVVNLLMYKFSKFASSSASIFRDLVILLVAFFVFGTSLTGVQLFGYAIATFAFMWYHNEEILRRNFRRGNPQRALVIGVTILLLALTSIMLLSTKYGLTLCQTQTETQIVEREKLVIVSRSKEDVSWLPVYLDERISYTVYQKGDAEATHSLPNKGNEASTYIKFILDNWEDLPKRMAFIHGHRQSWHSTGPVDQLLLKGNWDAAPFIKIPATFHHVKNLTIDDRSLGEDAEGNWRLKVFWDRFYAKHLGPPPEIIEYTCCAQFIVHNSTVHSRPKQLYQEIYDFLMSGEWADYWSGRMLEYTWHILFTGQPREVQVPFP